MAAMQFVRVVWWAEAMPTAPVGRARTIAEYRANRPRGGKVWLAGDNLGMATLECAIEIGTWAADRILER